MAQRPRRRILDALDRAEAFQRALDRGSVKSRADLARRHGLSRARVTQVLDLLKLDPEILDFVRGEATAGRRPPGTRLLRRLVRLPPVEQLNAAVRTLPGFEDRRLPARAS